MEIWLWSVSGTNLIECAFNIFWSLTHMHYWSTDVNWMIMSCYCKRERTEEARLQAAMGCACTWSAFPHIIHNVIVNYYSFVCCNMFHTFIIHDMFNQLHAIFLVIVLGGLYFLGVFNIKVRRKANPLQFDILIHTYVKM